MTSISVWCEDIFHILIPLSSLELLVESVFTFPHSNAEAERIFSIVTDIKNKKRNFLSDSMTSAICTIRSSFQADDINCVNFKVLILIVLIVDI